MVLIFVCWFSGLMAMAFYDDYKWAKKGKKWYEPRSETEKIQQYQRLKQLDKNYKGDIDGQ